MVRNIGPAIASGTITTTHKESEQMADLRMKQKQQLSAKQAETSNLGGSSQPVTLSVTNEFGDLIEPITVDTKASANEAPKQASPVDALIYGDLYNDVDLNNEHSTGDENLDFMDGSLTVRKNISLNIYQTSSQFIHQLKLKFSISERFLA